MFGFSKEEVKIFKSLNTPKKIQDFLNKIPINFEDDDYTCLSPRRVLLENKAHCVEGALFAAAALRVNGEKPLVMDLEATKKDFDHVICLFKRDGMWGSLSKTNHAVLRYREPVYKTIRELVMSFFHEYFDDNGKKNLRKYSLPVDLSRFDNLNWMTSEEELFEIPEYLADVRHINLLTRKQIASLRKADDLEIEAGKIVEWQDPKKKLKN